MTRPRNILCILCLLVAGTGYLSAGSPRGKVKADRHGVKESATAEFLPSKKQAGGKITFKCRITLRNGEYTLLAKVLKNGSAMHIVRPGATFVLANGDSVVLKAERPSACCSSWADGRWYNAAFRLHAADVEKLANTGILSVTIPFYGGEVSRNAAPGKENAIAKLLQSLED